MTTDNYFRDLVKEINDEYTSIVRDGLGSSEFSGYIDTGSYMLNALLSGSIYGGVPNNKIITFAGDPSTGKTFFSLGILKKFLDDNPTGGCVYFDTEGAVTKQMMEERGVDSKRVLRSEPESIEKFRTTILKVLDNYIEVPKDKRRPMLMILDSFGAMSSIKEIEDSTIDIEKKDLKKDMTKAPLGKALFRVIALKLAKAEVPFIVTNHVYAVIGGYGTSKEMSGGSGLKYASSQIVFLSKMKDKDGTEVVGNIIHCRTIKSRFTRENKNVDVKLSYRKGLDKYYGLLDLAERAGVFKRVATRYELPDGTKMFGKGINEEPEKYFTKDILDKLDKQAQKEFLYGEYEELKVDEITNEEVEQSNQSEDSDSQKLPTPDKLKLLVNDKALKTKKMIQDIVSES